MVDKATNPEIKPDEIKYATFSGRMLATVIDSLLSAILIIPLFGLFYKIFDITKPDLSNIPITEISNQEYMELLISSSFTFIIENIFVAIVIIILWVYKSATPGKMLLKMKIVDAKTFGKPTKWQSIIRYLAYFISFLPFCLGFIWIYYDKRGQGFHDKIAGTVVIKYD